MIHRPLVNLKLRLTPYQASLLISYLKEAGYRETLNYLRGFLLFSELILTKALEEDVSSIKAAHLLEEAEAILVEIRENGEPSWGDYPPVEPES